MRKHTRPKPFHPGDTQKNLSLLIAYTYVDRYIIDIRRVGLPPSVSGGVYGQERRETKVVKPPDTMRLP